MSLARLVLYFLSGSFSFFVGVQLGFIGFGREGTPTFSPVAITRVEDCSQESSTSTMAIEEPCPIALTRRGGVFGSEDGCTEALTLPTLHKSMGESTAVQVFPLLHHPGSLVCTPGEIVITQGEPWKLNGDSANTPFSLSPCRSVFMTRTGSKEGMPNKCAAVVSIPASQASPYFQTIRRGISAKLEDKYQNDYARKEFSYGIEKQLLEPILNGLDKLTAEFVKIMGNSINSQGERRIVTIMVVNSGVLDLLLNFLCSARAAKIDLSDTLVYVGQQSDIPLVQSLGLKAIHSNSLGDIPVKAAAHYADMTFSKLMWLKVTSGE